MGSILDGRPDSGRDPGSPGPGGRVVLAVVPEQAEAVRLTAEYFKKYPKTKASKHLLTE